MRASHIAVGAVALALALTGTSPAQAQTSPNAEPNQAAACVLRGGVAALIRLQLNAAIANLDGGSFGSNLKVDAIVIHSVSNPNNGQPLDPPNAGKFTGPIVCTFQEGFVPPQVPYAIAPTTANTAIPDIDLLASDVQTSIQFERNSNSQIEKLLCLSTKQNNSCFRIYPASGP